MIKKFLNTFLNYTGYRITKNKIYTFDHIYISFFTKNPTIIDVGANQGESVDRFLKIFQKPKIHCFEPALDSFNVLKKKYNSIKNIYLNNLGLSSKKEKKIINIFQRSCNSSFNEPIKDSFWEKKKKIVFKSDSLIKNKQVVSMITMDAYIKDKNIKSIDLLKIDTQGFESYVLKGCVNSFKKNIIKFVEIEFIMGNQYTNRLNIIDLEQHLIKNNFRLYGINQSGDLLNKPDMCFDLLYVNTKFININ